MLTPSTSDIVISSEQIQKRVREMARQITHDYAGKTIHALAVLENGFIFLSDLVRAIDLPVVCQFIKPQYRDDLGGMLEIFFSHDNIIVANLATKRLASP